MAGTSDNRPYKRPSRSQPRSYSRRSGPKPWPLMFFVGLIAFLPLLYGLAVTYLRLGQLLPLLIYAVISVISFSFYGYDKYRATESGRRIRESQLHLLDFFGGWPGGFFAQYFFRHKTRKLGFQLMFWACVMVHNYFWIRWCLLYLQ